MKGTIDVQIKHKDGSIETRHEHNVVFDIPAEVMKKIIQIPILGLRYWSYRQLGVDSINDYIVPGFALCEDTADLTQPKYLPRSLITTTGTSSKWYISPMTRVANDKNITAQASWTLGEAMTLKSIRILGNYNPDENRGSRFVNAIDDSSTLHAIGVGNTGKRLSITDFKFTNSVNMMRLIPYSELDSSNHGYVTAPLYYAYPLVNNERFAFVNNSNNGNPLYFSYGAAVSLYGTNLTTAKIQIFNSSTGDMVREFPFSQFSGLTTFTNVTYYVFVVNTGTKNILIRTRDGSTAEDPHIKCWQIPDTSTQDTIPTVDITLPDNFGNYPQVILDNYIVYGSRGSGSVFKLNDDLSVTTYKGYINGHVSWSSDSYATPFGYLPTGMMFLIDDALVRYPNLTAANFSTPIVLAEGDVLTVSYKIEVA